jgi:hypothetical protein
LELAELLERLTPFCVDRYGTDDVRVFDVVKMPGHAGFAYGFRVETGGRTDSWFLRLPPPNVNWRGTADVLRQVAVLNALDGTEVPHCSVKWSGDDLQWFDSPYFVVPWLEGDVLRLAAGEWGEHLSDSALLDLGKQVMGALAGIHKVDPAKAPRCHPLGPILRKSRGPRASERRAFGAAQAARSTPGGSAGGHLPR